MRLGRGVGGGGRRAGVRRQTGENGFLIGREAFTSEAELSKTVLHELYRLTTSVAKTAGVTAESAAAETKAAADFAEKAYAALKGSL